jgi:hypothetical protein
VANLEEIRAKFYVIQKSLDKEHGYLHSDGLTDFLGTVWEGCSTNRLFEEWFEEHRVDVIFYNQILARNEVSELNERELMEFYKHTGENIEKNLAENRKSNTGNYI